MNWFFVALLAPALWSATNHIDKVLLTKYFKSSGPGALIVFSALIGIPMLPLIWLIEPASLHISFLSAIILTTSGAIYLGSFLPYIHALARDDASVVVPLFQLVPVFSYILGYIFLQEQLTTTQSLSALLIITGSIGLSLDLSKGVRLKRITFMLMLLASLLVAFNSLLFKIVALKESFWQSSFWEYAGFALFGLVVLVFVKPYREQFWRVLKQNRTHVLRLNVLNEVINVFAKSALNFATLLAPLALVWVVNGFQPLFVFIYGVVLSRLVPSLVKEDLSRKVLIQKIAAIVIITAGSLFLNSATN
jgi:drug/metabolite transporter (DMT)-like permease